MTKSFKNPNKPYFGAILGPFDPNLAKNELSWKASLCQFSNILIIYHFAKNQKKLISHFWEKFQTNGLTDRQTDRQATVILKETSQDKGPIIKVT